MAKPERLLEVKDAVRIAKDYARSLFAEEGIENFGLEEVDYDVDADEWLITVGFSRPWNSTRNALTAITGDQAKKRAYRVVRMDHLGKVLSVKRRSNDE